MKRLLRTIIVSLGLAAAPALAAVSTPCQAGQAAHACCASHSDGASCAQMCAQGEDGELQVVPPASPTSTLTNEPAIVDAITTASIHPLHTASGTPRASWSDGLPAPPERLYLRDCIFRM